MPFPKTVYPVKAPAAKLGGLSSVPETPHGRRKEPGPLTSIHIDRINKCTSNLSTWEVGQENKKFKEEASEMAQGARARALEPTTRVQSWSPHGGEQLPSHSTSPSDHFLFTHTAAQSRSAHSTLQAHLANITFFSLIRYQRLFL